MSDIAIMNWRYAYVIDFLDIKPEIRTVSLADREEFAQKPA